MDFDFNSFMRQLIIQLPPLLFALTIHELAHGYVAWRLGDPTAKNEGRLTLNPLKHLDPLGVLAFIIMKIGWAKPVPVDPRYFRNPQRDMLLVALAGPGSNVILAVASAALAHLFVAMHPFPALFLPPTVGGHARGQRLDQHYAGGVQLHPDSAPGWLQGSDGFVARPGARAYARLEPFGFFILLALFYTGAIGWVILPIIRFSNSLLLG
jgi:hypothetical protein